MSPQPVRPSSPFSAPPAAGPGSGAIAIDDEALLRKTCADLGWGQLVEHIVSRCHTLRGQELARVLGPLPTLDAARLRQEEIREARALQDAGEPLSFGGICDVLPALQRSHKGGVLLPTELTDIAATLRAGARLRRHLIARKQQAPRLYSHAEHLHELPEVSGPIADAFDENSTLRDSASPALGPLRQRMNNLLTELQRRTDSLLQEAHIAPHLQDRFVTQREDRYVVPVRADARTKIRGIVHGTSASGATVFVEPEEIIELNNRLKLAQLEVAEEERRILTELSERVQHAAPLIDGNLQGLAQLDLIDGAARLATDLRATPVELVPAEALLASTAAEPVAAQDRDSDENSDGSGASAASGRTPGIDLRNGRHPLMVLSGVDVVANDVVLPAFGSLVISGPNAGGKTVALKLTGLCALMARAGLHLPVQEGSSLPWFDRVLTDVGDDQSIEKNLSTFSAHVLNLCRFLAAAGPSTLILLDEIAVGTDPEQGAALAQAVLEALCQSQATVLVTTHYDRLKALAANDARFCNASVGFDLKQLRPTYRLHLGIPGASSAVVVAERLGLPLPIVRRTSSLLSEGQTGVDRLMQALQGEREATHRLKAEAEAQRKEAKVARERADEALTEARAELLRARRKAHDEALAALQAARRELLDVKAALRAQADRARSSDGAPEAQRDGQREQQQLQQRLSKLAHEVAAAAPAREGPRGRAPRPDELVLGARVYVPRLGGLGTIASDVTRDKVVVQVGSLRLNAEVSELLVTEEGARSRPSSRSPATGGTGGATVSLATAPVPPRTPDATLDLRGERMPIAIARAEKFVDDALREQRSAVFILHGHGTGILRQSVRGHFASFPGVRRVRPADPEDGGDGVTVLELEG
ncbi:MAG: Smr/MutS family protein [Polyangia bacterium]